MARSTYTKEKADRICDLVIDNFTMRQIGEFEDLPSTKVIFEWLNKYEEFREQYARAREIQAELNFDELHTLANSTDRENFQARRLQVDTMKWRISKTLPKKYGEKMQVDMNDVTPIDARQETMAYIKDKLNKKKDQEA